MPYTGDVVIGVDGGNSKTDVVVAGTDGALLARARGAGMDSPLLDLPRWRCTLAGAVAEARALAGVPPERRAAAVAYFLANVDLPEELRLAEREIVDLTPAEIAVVHNDTHAILRAGASRPWGIAVVSGAGINAVGVDPAGRVEGFLSLGDITGDRGGGQDLGVCGLGAAMRHRDGRGPATTLTEAVPAHFGLAVPEDVAIAVHRGDIPYDDLYVLAPVVFAAAGGGDAVARRILSAFADEVVCMVSALLCRLDLAGTDVEVLLGGGVLVAGDRQMLDRIVAGVAAVAPAARVSVLDVPPVYGALVEAFDRAGADRAALPRLKRALLT